MAPSVNISVLGAGVMGLTTALLLARDERYNVTIIAKHMPGDYDIEYASPWAGANYLPVGEEGSALAQYERETFPELSRLASGVPEAGVHFQDAILYRRAKDMDSPIGGDWLKELMKGNPHYKDVVLDFRVLPKENLPPGHEFGSTYKSVCINTALYLPWLVGQCLINGAIVKRGVVTHISQAAGLHHSGNRADVVINCTGLSSLKLGGVEDKTLYPARGQTVIVRNDPGFMICSSGTDDGADEAMYVMNRAAGGGCVLGGSLQKNNWESQPDPNLAHRIMKRCVEMCPSLTNGKGVEALSVVRHAVGLRPMRQDGPRVQKEKIEGVWTVHNYGHGGYGYQSSYGSASAAVRLVKSIVMEKARL